MTEIPRSQQDRPRGFGVAARLTSLAGSVMDLHVRIALQEVDREKRRLISGGLFLAIGGILMLLALVAAETAFVLWSMPAFDWSLIQSLIGVAVLNLVVAGVSLRVGGKLAKGPYLPQTVEGLTKTTRAVMGR